MIDRRDFIHASLATMALAGGTLAGYRSAIAQQKITQEEILKFDAKGQVTLIHVCDIHSQAKPVYFREPSVNIGVGAALGLPPHITGKALLKKFGIKAGSPEAYALSSDDFGELAKVYGKMGGMDRVATLVKAIRAERPNHCLFLDSGDTWQGSWTSLQTKGEDMIKIMAPMKPDAITGHWEFTYGAERVKELIDMLEFPFLAGNVLSNEWEEPVFESTKVYERNGVKIAVIGQAFPYTPVANPRWMFPDWSFGIREKLVQSHVDAARSGGADLVVLLSHNGFDVDRKLASRVKGIDVILTGHTHDAIPVTINVNNTLLVASGCSGKFVSRLDLDVQNKKVAGFSYKLMPVFSDVITPDKEITAIVDETRAPYEKDMAEVLGTTKHTLYRRGNMSGTFDDLICNALIEKMDAEISLSPGFRWGTSLIPGQSITAEDVYNQTAMTYPSVYKLEFTGKQIKDILEDVGDNLFNPDPYFQQGGDMVRVGGLGFDMDAAKTIGKRITNLHLTRNGAPLEAGKKYQVAGWASVNKETGTGGRPVWELVKDYIREKKTIDLTTNDAVRLFNG